MSFIFLLLYIAVIYIRPQEWVPAIYGWPLINILAIATAVCVFFEAGFKQKLRVKEPHMMLLLAFLGAIAMSHLSHTYFGGAWDSVVKFSTNVIMFFLFINALNSEKRIKIVIWFIILLTVILAIQGIHQWNTGIGWAGQPIMEQRDGVSITRRITWIGIFNDPNDLALAFVVALGFLLAFLFGKTSFFVKIASVSLIGILGYSLYLTNSRGGYLALVAITIYYFLRRMKKKIPAIIIGLLLAFIIIIVGPSRLSDVSVQEDSAHGRIEAWYQGFQMLKSAPLFGVGYGMFTDYHEKTAHNSYILVAAEEGLIGLLVWIALIYVCFRGLHKVIEKNLPLKLCARGIESGLFGFLCVSYFLSRSYVTLLYVILALAASTIYIILKKEEYRFSIKDLRLSAALTVGVLFVTWISIRLSL
jgi:putative inorganic carbon (HCO3(-)) transporter